MAEGSECAGPQVFVVDSQANYVSVPSTRRPGCARAGQKFLFLLVGLAMLGLVVEGYLIYNLYKKTEALSLSESHNFCQNQSKPKTSAQQADEMSRVGPKESNEIPIVRPHPEQVQRRPFAQLIGSSNPVGQNNVVQWEHKGGEAITHNMGYNNGRLVIERDGYYYLYCKVILNAADECSLIQHKVMKDTRAYGISIELMKSKSVRCRTPKSSSAEASGGEDLWNSFLAGTFQLQSGDEIFVTLENIQKMRPGITENLMGAFMIFP